MPAKELYVNSRYAFSRAFSYCSDLWNNPFLIFRSDYKLESGVKEMKMKKKRSQAHNCYVCVRLSQIIKIQSRHSPGFGSRGRLAVFERFKLLWMGELLDRGSLNYEMRAPTRWTHKELCLCTPLCIVWSCHAASTGMASNNIISKTFYLFWFLSQVLGLQKKRLSLLYFFFQ